MSARRQSTSANQNLKPASAFAKLQFLLFLFSVWIQTLYFLHWRIEQPFIQRLWWAVTCELLCLLGRGTNEVFWGKFDFGDVVHHSTTLLGSCLALLAESCQKYSYLAVHMQILHWPMVIWYAGLRHGCVLPEFTGICALVFRPAWLWASAYRLSIMIATALKAQRQGGEALILGTLWIMALIFSMLDQR